MPHERILIVEDDAVARLDIQAALERSGYVIAGTASSGREAIRQADEFSPDLILMDIRLEGDMDGVEAANEIMRRYDIPIIFLTVYADDETLQWAKVSGPIGFLLKPVDHKELKSAIEVGLYKHQMEQELVKARKSAEAADRAKTSFLATVSHELRTPMNGVLGMTELLLLSDLGEPYRENVLLIKDSAMSLLASLNQIIDYSKIEASAPVVREIDFRLEDLVTGVLSQYEQAAASKGVKLEYTMDPALPKWFRGDSGKIRQVLGNLVGNAVKFTNKGTVSIDAAPAGDDGKGKGRDTVMVRILVADTGIGIPSYRVEEMFERFTLAEDYLSHGSGGLGLGLAIVHRLVKVMGGTVTCASEEGEGSTFSCVIPFKRSQFEEQTSFAAVTPEHRPFESVKVLVAEDDLVNQRFIMRLLEKMGCEVVLAENGLEAVDALKAEPFDVVLMDVEMPVMNGIEATRMIRQKETACLNPDIPIVALTAHAMWGDQQRCLHAGMDDYLSKPVDIDTVAAIIQSVVQGS